MSDLLHGRVEGWRYELVNAKLQVLRELSSILPGGTIDRTLDGEIAVSGNVTAEVSKLGDVYWQAQLIRVSYLLAGTAYPLVTGIPSAPSRANNPTADTVNVALFDRTQALSTDCFGETYTVLAGANPIEAAKAVVASVGELEVLADGYSGTLPASLSWDPAATKLQIVNDLLAAAGFFPVWADPLGRLRFTTYLLPQNRAISWDFADNAQGLYVPTWTHDKDVSNVPNRVVVGGYTDGAVAALVATATDTRPDSPFSYAARGNRWITRAPEFGVAFDGTPGGLQAIAERRLVEAQQVVESFTITHPWLPVGLNDAVLFTNRRSGTARATCQRQTIRLGVGQLVTSTFKVVL